MATSATAQIDHGAKTVLRYQNSYRVARTISGLSQVCKVAGLLTGILVVVFGVMGSETLMRTNPSMIAVANEQAQHNVYLISVIFFGALVALAGWIIGVVLDGYGQQLKATFDAAVNSSPFLSTLQRAQVMRLE